MQLNINPPKPLSELPHGTKLIAGLGTSEIIADFDFETYSEAGYVWNSEINKWQCPQGSDKKGLPVIGAARYSEHPSTEVLCMAYDLKDGKGPRQWLPGYVLPYDLFQYLNNGGLIEAWNAPFEHWIWENVCVKKYGWPQIKLEQFRDAAAKARAFSLPGSLDACGEVLNLKNKKDKEGKRLLKLFCMPRDPTRNNPSSRIFMKPSHTGKNSSGDLIAIVDEDSNKFIEYNIQDIRAEAEASSLMPDLQGEELEFWLCDRRINFRGVQLDIESVKNCIEIIEHAYIKYNAKLVKITNGAVNTVNEIKKLINWIRLQGINIKDLTIQTVEELLKQTNMPSKVKHVLHIRYSLSSSSVKKLYSMLNQVCDDGRLHDLFVYHAARTGRAAGMGPQPQNLPNSGPSLIHCAYCYKSSINKEFECPWCGNKLNVKGEDHTIKEWSYHDVELALGIIKTKSLELVEYYYEDPFEIIPACLRGLFISAPGKDLICSDYSAIEAVVLAALSGEQWRLDVFNDHGKIYEVSASKITGVPFKDIGKESPLRKLGKVAELASGYQGWVEAWKRFKADQFLSDEEIKKSVLAWRASSPAIVEMWGGQFDRQTKQPRYYGLEGNAILAILNPRQEYDFNGIKYLMRNDILYCRLLSGRYLIYHKPRLGLSTRGGYEISFETWNTNPTTGAKGWIRTTTYGGRLTENVVQATARDILAHAIINLERSGYPVVLHVHDEIVSEIPENFGSIEEFEKIMSTMPAWASTWPIRAKGGWRGKRYRK